ncbi:alpha/beta fold hydrolase [Shouchella patagoniensis]|uniref:alpha/beta fold hydrolase n=1 Tax=Shouchella patagoniensis TaxID=228576 RepID=UPI000995074B|nr:alpha/beta hydrolase [Shouchella patagoniensis]
MAHSIEVEHGTKIYVEDIGSGQPVVFLHGWPVNHKMFEHQMNTLPELGFRFIGVDLRGYGQSDKPAHGYDYDQMADDLRVIFDTLELKDAVLCGFSMGGAIAIRYMAKHGGKGVARLALMGAAGPVFTERSDFEYGMPKENVDDLIDGAYADRAQMLEDFGAMFFGKKPSNAFNAWFHSLGMEAGPHATIGSARTLRDADLREDLKTIMVLTVIMHGRNDEICPYDLAKQMEAGIEDATIIPFEESGHSLFHDEHKKFNDVLIQFISEPIK